MQTLGGNSVMDLNNKTQKQAYKLAMKILGKMDGKYGKRYLAKELSHPEYGPYKEVSDAKKFVKDLVNAEEVNGNKCVVDSSQSFVFRKDMKTEVSL